MICEIVNGDCIEFLKNTKKQFNMSFLDPPFNQGKEYHNNEDNLEPAEYWKWMTDVCKLIYEKTPEGGSIFFMQREKNTKYVLEALDSSGWTFQSLIIWKKKTSAVPQAYRFGKHYQIIAFYCKGPRPSTFNKLRINPPLLVTEKYERKNGMYVTDVWDDIRELTSGYFAGDEPLKNVDGSRAHLQQSPLRLLARIILSSTNVGDMVFDPFAGSGTTLVVSQQLKRNSIGVELAESNVELIKKRIAKIRKEDNISKIREDYFYTENLDKIWNTTNKDIKQEQFV